MRVKIGQNGIRVGVFLRERAGIENRDSELLHVLYREIFSSCSLGWLLSDELAGLLDTGLKQREVLHDELDVLDGQIDEHTGDLGGLLGSDELVDVLVEDGADLGAVVGVLRHERRKHLMAGEQVLLLDAHRRLLGRGRHGLLLGRRLRLHLVGDHHVLLRVLMHHVATAAVVHLVARRTVLRARASREALLVRAAHLTHVWTLLLLHEEGHRLKEHLEVVLHLLLVGEIGPLSVLRVLLAEDLEIVLIARCLVLKLTDFLDLVVVNGQGLVVDGEALLGRRCLIWLLEADKGVELLGLCTRRVHLEGLNLTVAGEEVAELILTHGGREALDVEVAPLLRALVLDGLAKTLLLAISALKCFFHVKLLVVRQGNAVDVSFTVKLFDSFLGATGAILPIVLVLRVEADEGVRALVVSHVLH